MISVDIDLVMQFLKLQSIAGQMDDAFAFLCHPN